VGRLFVASGDGTEATPPAGKLSVAGGAGTEVSSPHDARAVPKPIAAASCTNWRRVISSRRIPFPIAIPVPFLYVDRSG
jgi:hypothetical protein